MPDSFSGLQIVLLGLLILVVGFLLRRSFMLNKRSRKRDPASEVRKEMHAAERSATSGIRKLEIRLHDYGREVEGRVQTTLTLLDRLILEADRESHRLLTLLGDSGTIGDESDMLRQPDVVIPDSSSVIVESGEPNPATVAQPLSAEQQEMVGQLQGGGYTLEQIARLLRRSPNDILSVLRQADDSAGKDQTDAA